MALSATIAWEVRTAGSDSSGGGFNSAAAGSDYSQQDAARYSGTNLTVDGAANAKVTPDGHTPDATDVGNVVQITTTGTGAAFTTGFYEITAQGGGQWTLDRSPAAVGSAGATWAMGGALASPGKAGSGAVASNDLYVKSGTYTVSSASTNVAGGCVSWPAAVSTTNAGKLQGYGTSRGDGGAKPLLQASGIATFTLLLSNAGNRVENLSFDGASLTSSRGLDVNASGASAYRCKAANCTNNGIRAGLGVLTLLCEATGCSAQPAFLYGQAVACTAHDNTVTGFSALNNGSTLALCLAANNTGASSDGFALSGGTQCGAWGCTAYASGRDGFRLQAGTSQSNCVNCLAVNNAGFGFNASAAFDNGYLYNCAGRNNTSGNVNSANIAAAQQIGFLALTGDPFSNAAGNDFSLNNTSGAGASCRAAGIPGSTASLQLPGLSTLSYPDVGAVQHRDTGGGAPVIGSAIVQGLGRVA